MRGFFGVAALVISIFSWRVSLHANRAAVFDRRFEVYRDVEKFIGAWQRHGRPDMKLLGDLVDAWNRSHFLFPAQVTTYLRKVWVDATSVDYHTKVAAGETPGDVEKSQLRAMELTGEHVQSERLRNAFLPYLKVSDGHLSIPAWLAKLFAPTPKPWLNVHRN